MRGRFAAALALLSLGGCQAVLREVCYPGGYPGHVLDQRTFDASRNKRLQLLRGAIVFAMAARIGEGAVRGEDGDGFARQLQNAAAEINYAAANLGMSSTNSCKVADGAGLPTPASEVVRTRSAAAIRGPIDGGPGPTSAIATDPAAAPDVGCAGYFVNFETDVARLESRLVRATIAALPTERAKKFLQDVAKGNVLAAAWNAMAAGADLAGSFHRASGVYRSGLEIVAATGSRCGPDGAASYDELEMTVLDAAQCLGLDPERLFDAEDATGEQLAGEIPEKAFHAVMRVARESCVALPLSNELDQDELLASRLLRRKACAAVAFRPVPRGERVEF